MYIHTIKDLELYVEDHLGDTWEADDVAYAINKLRDDGFEFGMDIREFLKDQSDDYLYV